MKLAKIVPIPRGAYSPSATYNALDIVKSGGASYICCVDGTTGIIPEEGDTWKVIALDGDSMADTVYDTGDSANTTIADTDYVPFSNSAGTTKQKISWTNIKTILGNVFAALSHSHTKSQITDFTHTHIKTDITDLGTIGTAAAKDAPASGNASGSGQVVLGNDTRLTDSRNAKDVYSWAKASSKPSYDWSEITRKPKLYKLRNTEDVRITLSTSISIPIGFFCERTITLDISDWEDATENFADFVPLSVAFVKSNAAVGLGTITRFVQATNAVVFDIIGYGYYSETVSELHFFGIYNKKYTTT